MCGPPGGIDHSVIDYSTTDSVGTGTNLRPAQTSLSLTCECRLKVRQAIQSGGRQRAFVYGSGGVLELREGRVPDEYRADRVMCDRKAERRLDRAVRITLPHQSLEPPRAFDVGMVIGTRSDRFDDG